MKIVYLSSSTLISDAANSVHVMKMCQAFAKLGHEVTLYGLCGEGSLDEVFSHYGVEPVFQLVRHDENSDSVVRNFWAIRKSVPGLRVGGLPSIVYGARVVDNLVRTAQPDLIYARNMCWLSGLTTPVTSIVDSHGMPRNFLERMMEGRIYRRPNFRKLVVTSERLRMRYLDLFPWLASRIEIARNGADDPLPSRHVARQINGFHVGYVGHLYEGRGVEDIVSMAHVIPEATFHIVGGTDGDRKRIFQITIPRNVIFHGYQSQLNLSRFYPYFDVMLAPYQGRIAVSGGVGGSVEDMSPLKIFEYMSWGKAILCSDMTLLREILTNECNSLLLPPGDLGAWVAAIRRLLHDEKERYRLGANARSEFLSKYTWAKRARNVLSGLAGCR